jgi:hypothetical protein
MALTGAERQKRRRAHARGDHRLCGPKCTAQQVRVAVSTVQKASTVSDAVEKFAATVAFDDGDPRSVGLACAFVLARFVDDGVAPVMAAGQVSSIITGLAGHPGEGPNQLDVIRARTYAKHVQLATNFADSQRVTGSGR